MLLMRALWQPRLMEAIDWIAGQMAELGGTSYLNLIEHDQRPLTAALLLNATPMQMGILVALETLPFALVSLHAGVLLDRVRKLPIVILADIGRGVALLAIPLAAWLGVLSIEILYIVGFLCGIQNVVGGAAYLLEMSQEVATAAHAEHYAKIVRDKSVLRSLIHASTGLGSTRSIQSASGASSALRTFSTATADHCCQRGAGLCCNSFAFANA